MKNKKFWQWVKNEIGENERTLIIDGIIAEDSWYDDDVTPQMFRDELDSGDGNIVVWINSYGGDCIAAARIYNMLTEYNGKVTVKIDGIAASAASVIAMSGEEILMSPTSTMMIHNPATFAFGESSDMKKAIEMLEEIKESIINAYEIKTGLSRAKLSKLMDAETWMNANKAVELGFADRITERENVQNSVKNTIFSQKAINNVLMNKISEKYNKDKKSKETGTNEHSVNDIMERLSNIKKYI